MTAKVLLAFVAGCAAAAAAGAQTPSEVQQFEQAMAAGALPLAAEVVDMAAARRRLESQQLRPAPVLFGMIGRFQLAVGDAAVAIAYLERAVGPEVPAPQRAAALLALAEAQQAVGDREAAAASLTRLSGETLERGQRLRASLAAARNAVVTDPRAAVALAAPLAASGDPGFIWEAELIAAQAHALSGNLAAAEVAGERAWAAALRAPAERMAAARTALLHAALAAARGDEERVVAMLFAAAGTDLPIASQYAGQSPQCGRSGVRPEDWVTFGVVVDSWESRSIFPLAASRPAVVAPFHDSVVGRPVTSTSPPGTGTLFTVRCRNLVVNHPPRLRRRPAAEWLAARGVVTPVSVAATAADAASLAAHIAEVERRFGPAHPSLAGLRLALVWLLEEIGPHELPKEIELQSLFENLVASFPDPEGFAALSLEFAPALFYQAAEAPLPGAGLPELRQRLLAAIDAAPTDVAYYLASAWTRVGLPDPVRAAIVERALRRFAAGSPEHRALVAELAGAKRAVGDKSGASNLLRQGGFDGDLCYVQEEQPAVDVQPLSDADYPLLALRHGIEGVTVAEADVTGDGRLAEPRIVLSAPSRLFDSSYLAAVPRFRMSPARERGRARPCRANFQRIQWRLPDSVYPPPRGTEDEIIAPVRSTPVGGGADRQGGRD